MGGVRKGDTMTMTNERIEELITEAKRSGADHALAMASFTEMDEATAQSVLDDVDPEVMDGFAWPNLSGEYADGPTPDSLYDDLGLTDDERDEIREQMLFDPICGAWEDEASEVFDQALQGVALRWLGRIDDALRVERELEKHAKA